MYKAIFIIILTALFYSCSQDSATIREESITFETYPFSDPDPVPRPERKYYPYFRYDGFSKTPDSISWKVVVMENAWVKLHIFPEIGGKIWGAIEKSTGNEFIYYNSVVKFRDVAMRGPWTSGGIEFNFGIIGHTPAVSTPVDYFIKNNSDGSVSCFIGTLDLITRTRWETEVNLSPDKAYFTTNTKWNNSTPFVQPYYQWSNAAYQSAGDLEMIFPGNNWIGHDGEGGPWPVDKTGRNLSLYENNNFGGSKSYHIAGGPNDFFAAYWHDLNFGAGHYSMYGDKLGKKIWIWSLARSGGIWEELLTDSDGQYVELQAGRLFNQASTRSTRTPFKHFGFAPYAADEFKEFWYPIMDVNGAVKANPSGILNVIKEESSQKVLFSSLQYLKDDIQIYFGDELKYTFKINLKPLEKWEENISINSSSEPLKIIIGKNGEFVYSEEKKSINSGRPLEAPSGFDWNSIYGLYADGLHWIYQNRYDLAYESLNACLEKDPFYAPAHNLLAELYYKKADFKTALAHAKKSLSINTYDPQANYVFGLTSRQLNNLPDSQDGFSVASLSPSYRTASYIELAKLFILKDELYAAEQYCKKVLSSEIHNEDAILLMTFISRKSGRIKEAEAFIELLEDISPLNHFGRSESMFVNSDKASEDHLLSLIRTELPQETLIEMACWYEYIGHPDEAIKLLEMSPENALISLKLSYLYHIKNDLKESDFYFEKTLRQSPDFILPFRPEFMPALKWAVGKTTEWKPKYYLGLLQWSFNNKAEAKVLFSDCGQIPESPYFYLAKTDLFKDDLTYNPENDLIRAQNLGKSDWRTSLSMIDYYLSKNRPAEALEAAEKSLKVFPESDIIRYTYAKCLLANGNYSASLNVLENTVILPYEGAGFGRVMYKQVAVMESLDHYKNNNYDEALKSAQKARLWPENLGVGRPYDVDERTEDFLEAQCYLRLNNKEKATELYDKIIEFSKDNRGRNNSTDYIYLIVLKRLGREAEINEFLKKWQQNSPNDPVMKWSRAMINNNFTEAQRIEREISTESGGTPWDPRYADSEFELVKAMGYNLR